MHQILHNICSIHLRLIVVVALPALIVVVIIFLFHVHSVSSIVYYCFVCVCVREYFAFRWLLPAARFGDNSKTAFNFIT